MSSADEIEQTSQQTAQAVTDIVVMRTDEITNPEQRFFPALFAAGYSLALAVNELERHNGFDRATASRFMADLLASMTNASTAEEAVKRAHQFSTQQKEPSNNDR